MQERKKKQVERWLKLPLMSNEEVEEMMANREFFQKKHSQHTSKLFPTRMELEDDEENFYFVDAVLYNKERVAQYNTT